MDLRERRLWRTYLPPVRLLSAFMGQQALACVFPFSLMAALAATQLWRVPALPRYDLILLVCLLIQYAMYRTGWETRDEVKVIASFHAVGLALELFKTHMHSWAYPEPAWTKVGGVPLYSGFMYASVASYLCQASDAAPQTRRLVPSPQPALSCRHAVS